MALQQQLNHSDKIQRGQVVMATMLSSRQHMHNCTSIEAARSEMPNATPKPLQDVARETHGQYDLEKMTTLLPSISFSTKSTEFIDLFPDVMRRCHCPDTIPMQKMQRVR